MNANELAELADVADEFLYRYADEGGNFKDPFLNAVYIQLCQQHHAMKALEAKTLTDEEVIRIVKRFVGTEPLVHEIEQAILKKASEK